MQDMKTLIEFCNILKGEDLNNLKNAIISGVSEQYGVLPTKHASTLIERIKDKNAIGRLMYYLDYARLADKEIQDFIRVSRVDGKDPLTPYDLALISLPSKESASPQFHGKISKGVTRAVAMREFKEISEKSGKKLLIVEVESLVRYVYQHFFKQYYLILLDGMPFQLHNYQIEKLHNKHVLLELDEDLQNFKICTRDLGEKIIPIGDKILGVVCYTEVSEALEDLLQEIEGHAPKGSWLNDGFTVETSNPNGLTATSTVTGRSYQRTQLHTDIPAPTVADGAFKCLGIDLKENPYVVKNNNNTCYFKTGGVESVSLNNNNTEGDEEMAQDNSGFNVGNFFTQMTTANYTAGKSGIKTKAAKTMLNTGSKLLYKAMPTKMKLVAGDFLENPYGQYVIANFIYAAVQVAKPDDKFAIATAQNALNYAAFQVFDQLPLDELVDAVINPLANSEKAGMLAEELGLSQDDVDKSKNEKDVLE